MDWVRLTWNLSVPLPADSDWSDDDLAEAAGQLSKMAEQSQPNPDPQADGTTCSMLTSQCDPSFYFFDQCYLMRHVSSIITPPPN